jgi:hypothetical protein
MTCLLLAVGVLSTTVTDIYIIHELHIVNIIYGKNTVSHHVIKLSDVAPTGRGAPSAVDRLRADGGAHTNPGTNESEIDREDSDKLIGFKRYGWERAPPSL